MGIVRYIAFALLLAHVFGLDANAATVPATPPGQSVPFVESYRDGGGSYVRSTLAELFDVVSALAPGKYTCSPGTNPLPTKANNPTFAGSCVAPSPYSGYNFYTRYYCPPGSVTDSASPTGCKSSSYTCPDDTWILNGSTCTKADSCQSGQTIVNGSCKCDSGASIGKDGQCCSQGDGEVGRFNYCSVASPNATSCNTQDSNGCALRCPSVTFQKPPSGDTIQIYPRMALGSNCRHTGSLGAPDDPFGNLNDSELNEIQEAVKDPTKAKKPTDCLAAGLGYVQSSSGSTTCVKAGDGGDLVKTGTSGTQKEGAGGTESGDVETKSTNGPNGSGIEERKEVISNADGTKSIITTKSTKGEDGTVYTEKVTETFDENGNKTGGNTEKSNNPADEFCQKNPSSPLCKKESSEFSGSCESGFSCSGDAATCATARGSWELRCTFSGGSGGLIDEFNSGGTPGDLTNAELALNKTGSGDFNIAEAFQANNQQWLTFSASCPVADQTFNVAGAQIEIKAAQICDVGVFVRFLIHLVAYMALARVFATKLV